VSLSVSSELHKLAHNVSRIGGSDRFEVAKNIASHFGTSDTAIVVNGLVFADALSIAPYAARHGYPILLTTKDSLPQHTKVALQGKRKSLIVGGVGSVSLSVSSQLPFPSRIGGKDRYEVAANVIRNLNLQTEKVFLATGLTFADALTGSVLAAKENAPLLLTLPDRIPDATRAIINEKGISIFTILGGLGSVQQKVVAQIAGPLAGLTIAVDPGHGGDPRYKGDPGAVGYNLQEKNIVLDVGKRLQGKLEAVGAAVLMTRQDDSAVSLSERVDIANSNGANSFVSIHVNSFDGTGPNGTETYWNSLNSSADSKELATEIQKELIQELGTRDRGVKEASFYVIKNTTMPSVLVEIAFISNPIEASKLADSAFREKAAEAIYQGILNFYQKN